MLKKWLLIGFLLMAPGVMAQEAFWGFDDNGDEMIIPPECDTTFDADELYDIGIRLLDETGSARMGAAYCLLSSAFAGHVGAQLEVAKMYHKGIGMPKSDLAAYKWATLAALNGNEEADQLGASIEQFLSIQDIELSTNSLANLIGTIKMTREQELAAEKQAYEDMKTQLSELKKDISDLERYGKIRPRAKPKQTATATGTTASGTTGSAGTTRPTLTKSGGAPQPRTQPARANEPIFSQNDLNMAPMPTR